MSGHSKWSQIKHQKALTDKKKSSLFGKLAKAISVASKDNPDIKTNSRLRTAVEQARSFDMPRNNIERILKKASSKDTEQLHDLILEAFGPGGVGIVITAITDNKNRTIGDLKTLLSKNGAHLSGQGSALWMFKQNAQSFKPTTMLSLSESDHKQLELILKALDEHDDVQDVFSNEKNETDTDTI